MWGLSENSWLTRLCRQIQIQVVQAYRSNTRLGSRHGEYEAGEAGALCRCAVHPESEWSTHLQVRTRHVVPGLVLLRIGLHNRVRQLFRVARVVRILGEPRDADARLAGLNGCAGAKCERYGS